MGHIRLALPILHPMFSMVAGKKEELFCLARPRSTRYSEKQSKWVENRGHQKKLRISKSDDPELTGSQITVHEYMKAGKSIHAKDVSELLMEDQFNESSVNHVKGKTENVKDYLLTTLPVIPVTLRPYLLDKNNSRFLIGDLNTLYSDVVIANNRLKKALEEYEKGKLSHQQIHFLKEKLEIVVNQLFFYGKKDDHGKFLKSLSHMIKGKQGLLRKSKNFLLYLL